MIAVLTLLGVADYVRFTYLLDIYGLYYHQYISTDDIHYGFKWTLFAVFTFDYLLSIHASPNSLRYLRSRNGIVDLLVSISLYYTGELVVIKFVKFIQYLKLKQHQHSLGSGGDVRADLSFELTRIMLSNVIFIFGCTSIVHSLEAGRFEYYGAVFRRDLAFFVLGEDTKFYWHDALYFVIVTFTTVGYGDISPNNFIARMLVIFLVVLAFCYVPVQASELVAILSRCFDKESGAFSGKGHLVICVSKPDVSNISYFLTEFFEKPSIYPERSNAALMTHAMILAPHKPDRALLNRIRRFLPPVKFLQGSALVPADLRRANVKKAGAVFILPSLDEQMDADDRAIFLSYVAARNFIGHQPQTKALRQNIYVQTRTKTTKSTLMSIGMREHVISYQELNYAFMAVGLTVPGFLAWSMNLLRARIPQLSNNTPEWQRDYNVGAGFNLFVVKFTNDAVDGMEKVRTMTVQEIASMMFDCNESVLVAAQIYDEVTDEAEVMINPSSRFMDRPMQLLVIATDQIAADRSFRYVFRYHGIDAKAGRDSHSRDTLSRDSESETPRQSMPGYRPGQRPSTFRRHESRRVNLNSLTEDEVCLAPVDPSSVVDPANIKAFGDARTQQVESIHSLGIPGHFDGSPRNPRQAVASPDLRASADSLLRARNSLQRVAQSAAQNQMAGSMAETALSLIREAEACVSRIGPATVGGVNSQEEDDDYDDDDSWGEDEREERDPLSPPDNIRDHYVICIPYHGDVSRKLVPIVKTMKLMTRAPIVVVTALRETVEAVIKGIRLAGGYLNPEIYFCKASVLNQDTLESCAADQALAFLVLRPPEVSTSQKASQAVQAHHDAEQKNGAKSEFSQSREESRQADSHVLMAAMELQSFLAAVESNAHVIYELLDENSVFLLFNDREYEDNEEDDKLKNFKSWARRTLSVIDQQDSRTSKVGNVAHTTRLNTGRQLNASTNLAMESFAMQNASGQAFVAGMIDYLAVQAFYEPVHIKFWEIVLGIKRVGKHKPLNGSSYKSFLHEKRKSKKKGTTKWGVKNIPLLLVDIPELLVDNGANYGDLWRHCNQRSLVCLGLYRSHSWAVQRPGAPAPKGSRAPWMWTCPPKGTVLDSMDKVLILIPHQGFQVKTSYGSINLGSMNSGSGGLTNTGSSFRSMPAL